ncbi:transposase [Streptomyces sp. NPDC006510]|uniref:IS110 family transposase n=1 Tax=Streptomyces sp. NPDC006510 TaxID=3155600 RepID=UPI0033AFF40C
MRELWAGTDAGRGEHHCAVIDADGTKVLSRRVPNNEPELLELWPRSPGTRLFPGRSCPPPWWSDWRRR